MKPTEKRTIEMAPINILNVRNANGGLPFLAINREQRHCTMQLSTEIRKTTHKNHKVKMREEKKQKDAMKRCLTLTIEPAKKKQKSKSFR